MFPLLFIPIIAAYWTLLHDPSLQAGLLLSSNMREAPLTLNGIRRSCGLNVLAGEP